MILRNEQEFEVGQIVFFIASKTESVIPALIAEKIVRTRIDGEQIGYVLHVNTSRGRDKIEVDPLKVRLFPTTADVREHMINLASLAIDKLISLASDSANKLSGTIKNVSKSSMSSSKPPSQLPELNIEEESGIAEVVLDDGRVAKVRLS